jgi:NAD-dependent dihydropyrimidine dehydrogenase PreA subunit
MISVDRQACNGCGLCVESCPTGALQLVDDLIQVESSLCEECYACVDVCPQEALVPSEIMEETDQIPAAPSSLSVMDEIGISASSNKPLTRPTITDLGPPRRSLGDWLGAVLDFLVYDLGPAIEGIIRTERQRKGGDAASFRQTGNAQREKRGRRRSGRKARRRRRGRQ